MRLLILSPISPLPIFTGGRQRLYQITREQARRHDVTFLSFCRNEEEQEGLMQLARELEIRVVSVPFMSLKGVIRGEIGPDTLALARGRWRAWRERLPAAIPAWDQPAMHRALTQELARASYDILQVEWPYLAPYALRPDLPPTALITHDIFSVGLARRAAVQSDARARARLREQAHRWEAYERAIYPRFSLVAAMSETDAAIIRARAPEARVILSPNGVDARGIQPQPIRAEARHLLFVGSPTHEPNLDAACWLLTTIWPRLHARHPHLTLTLVNLDHPQVHACAAGAAQVRITGRVVDVLPYYRQADIALAPIRAGSGTRLKILEAFAAGVPVVSTSIGHEGLAVTPGEHLLVGDQPETFVAGIERLLASPQLRRRLAHHARSLVEARYDWSKIVDDLDEAYKMVTCSNPSASSVAHEPA